MALILASTPIGNLRDITLRTIDALREASVIVAENASIARKLLSALRIAGKDVRTYREDSAERLATAILERARVSDVMVTSDAGTPDRRVFVRELTTRFEERLFGTAEPVRRRIPDPPRGEFMLALERTAGT